MSDLHVVYFWLNTAIFLMTLTAETYYLLYKLNRCSKVQRPPFPLVDKSAIIIVVFYTLGFFLKFVGVLFYKIEGKEESWVIMVTYAAIIVIWVLLYYFTFEMERVYIQINTHDMRQTATRLNAFYKQRLIVLISLIVCMSIQFVVITLQFT